MYILYSGSKDKALTIKGGCSVPSQDLCLELKSCPTSGLLDAATFSDLFEPIGCLEKQLTLRFQTGLHRTRATARQADRGWLSLSSRTIECQTLTGSIREGVFTRDEENKIAQSPRLPSTRINLVLPKRAPFTLSLSQLISSRLKFSIADKL